MPEYKHEIDIKVKFQTFEEAQSFWLNLHGAHDVLGEMENGIYIATGERPHVDISPGNEDFLNHVATQESAWR